MHLVDKVPPMMMALQPTHAHAPLRAISTYIRTRLFVVPQWPSGHNEGVIATTIRTCPFTSDISFDMHQTLRQHVVGQLAQAGRVMQCVGGTSLIPPSSGRAATMMVKMQPTYALALVQVIPTKICTQHFVSMSVASWRRLVGSCSV
jgi:hypothetical protein